MNGPMGMRPGIILLCEGTDTLQGKAQLVKNINACQAVADAVRTTLGLRGMDKLVVVAAPTGTGAPPITRMPLFGCTATGVGVALLAVGEAAAPIKFWTCCA